MKIKDIKAISICISILLFFISQALLRSGSELSVLLKLFGFLFLIPCIDLHKKAKKQIYLLYPISIIFIMSFYKSHDYSAAAEELIRFLFPVFIIIAVMASKNKEIIVAVSKFLILLTVSNNLYQIYFYLAYFTGLPVLHDVFYDMGYIIRAEGWAGSFGLFGLMNFVCFLIVKHGDVFEKRNSKLEYFFIVFALLSTTAKIIAAFLVYIAATQKTRRGVRFFISLVILGMVAFLFQPKLLTDYIISIDGKINAYLLSGESARSESYRVMKESVLEPNIIGEGLGSFGGPSSITSNSPLYEKYQFNWYGLNSLATTDTFYPHLFVEIGLIGGGLYLLFLFTYGQRNKTIMWWVIMIAFMIDNISSFSMLAPPSFFVIAIALNLFSRVPEAKVSSSPSYYGVDSK